MAQAKAAKKAKPKAKAKKAKIANVNQQFAYPRPFIPQDQLTGREPNRLLAADVLELLALFAPDRHVALAELTSAIELGQDEYENVDEVILERDRILNECGSEIGERSRQIGDAYPFEMDDAGTALHYKDGVPNWGQIIYVLSLLLSHLPSESDVLSNAGFSPTDAEIVRLRRWFQYCATASVAAEINGDAWAFGWPRPDGSAFLDKLKEIWATLRDGAVRDEPDDECADHIKDDEIDIIAARQACDGLNGFPIALGQVASGGHWRSKSLRGHADHVFFQEWFSTHPGSQAIVYHVIPFVVEPRLFRRQTRRLGHLMHRTRLSARALEASKCLERGDAVKIEGTDAFDEVRIWTSAYIQRCLQQ